MRKVVSSHEVMHLWAHKSQDAARNANHSVYFENETIYSYGSHFPMARHYTNKRGEACVLFNTASYSVTTSGHQSGVREAVRHLTVFKVPNVQGSWNSEPDHESNVADYVRRINKELATAVRARLEWSRHSSINTAGALRDEMKAYGEFFDVKVPRVTVPELGSAELAKLKATLDKQAAAERARTRKEREERIQAFRDGRANHVTGLDRQLLRIQGEEVVTSMGARVPIEHARRGLKFVRGVRKAGEEWRRNGHTFHLGPYAIDRVEPDGTLHAGCHTIAWQEIERLAPELERKGVQP